MLFEFDDVSLARGGRTVLDGFSARLPEGVSAILGPSGSGKSTALRLLNRLADPDCGVVRYRGDDVRDLDPLALRREACLVPQLPALTEGTVADNIRFAADLAEREPDVGAVLERAGLDPGYADRPADRLSVGEQGRAMLARALAQEPRVLLLDEPTASLDEASRRAIEETISTLAGDPGASIVLVTHDEEQAGRLADWIVRIAGGRAAAEGAAEEVVAR